MCEQVMALWCGHPVLWSPYAMVTLCCVNPVVCPPCGMFSLWHGHPVVWPPFGMVTMWRGHPVAWSPCGVTLWCGQAGAENAYEGCYRGKRKYPSGLMRREDTRRPLGAESLVPYLKCGGHYPGKSVFAGGGPL